MLTLVIYDISEDKPRTKLAKHLQEFGLSRVQYSGFVGELNPNDRIILSKEVKQYITPLDKKIKKKEKEADEPLSERDLAQIKPDSIYVIPLCERCTRICRIVSDQDLCLGPQGEVTIVG